MKIVVAVGFNPHSERLLGRAAALARGLDGALLAVHIRPPDSGTDVSDANLDWNCRHARALGATIHIVEGRDVAETLVRFAREESATHVVLGQSDISRWQEMVRGSVINKILRQHAGLDIYIVTEEAKA